MSSTLRRGERCATVVFSSLKPPIKQPTMCGIDNQNRGSCVKKRNFFDGCKAPMIDKYQCYFKQDIVMKILPKKPT